MDWMKLRTYSGKRKAPKNVHCASPVPGMVVPGIVGRKNAPRRCLDLPSKRRRQPCAKRLIGSVSAKTLSAIKETSQVDCFSAKQSVEQNYNKNTGMNMNENMNETDSTTSQDYSHLTSGSRDSLGNSDTSSGLTLPTGVSDFLLECLDSSIDANAELSDGTNSYSSPETFRHGSDLEEICASPKRYLGCKNSTLLDTSKAINIDKIPPLPDFSEIFENTMEGQGERLISYTLSKSKQCCESTDVSATGTDVSAGKQVYKILSSKEKTPKSQPSEILILPPKQSKQLSDQQSRNMKFRRKGHFRSVLESIASSSSSAVLPSAISKISVPSHGSIAGELASEEPGADMLDLPSVQKAASNEKCSNTTSLCLGETVPTSSNSNIFQYLHHPPEICCIIKASPEFKPLKVVQHPPRQISFPPKGVPIGKRKGYIVFFLTSNFPLLIGEIHARMSILEKNHYQKLLGVERALDCDEENLGLFFLLSHEFT